MSEKYMHNVHASSFMEDVNYSLYDGMKLQMWFIKNDKLQKMCTKNYNIVDKIFNFILFNVHAS